LAPSWLMYPCCSGLEIPADLGTGMSGMELNCMSTFPVSDDLLRYDDNKLTKLSESCHWPCDPSTGSGRWWWLRRKLIKATPITGPFHVSCLSSLQCVIVSLCYVLGLTQGAFFIFHLLTKPFPSHDQPPTHLDHMTSHLLPSHLHIT